MWRFVDKLHPKHCKVTPLIEWQEVIDS
ncbi:protein of unknown function [Magnetospirillum sp. XM-1]|nr:protein of unknown function [Magnetospirillum sp. XM-1]